MGDAPKPDGDKRSASDWQVNAPPLSEAEKNLFREMFGSDAAIRAPRPANSSGYRIANRRPKTISDAILLYAAILSCLGAVIAGVWGIVFLCSGDAIRGILTVNSAIIGWAMMLVFLRARRWAANP